VTSTSLNHKEIQRYSRHLLLSGFGVEGQERLKHSSVLCIGAGGLGSPALLYLAAAGVGRIGIVDFDSVDISNLQRQVLFESSQVGQSKAQMAKQRICALNPLVQVDCYNEAVTPENVMQRISEYDVVIDGTDNFPTRYLVSDACERTGTPYVYGSIFQFEGQVSVFNYQQGPGYRDLFPEPPAPGSVPSCGEAGVLGVLPGVVGGLQATEAIKIMTGIGDVLSGRLLLYDALRMTFHEIQVQKDPDRVPVDTVTHYTEWCVGGVPGTLTEENKVFTQISVEELKQRRDEGWRPYVLDTRWEHEAQIASLPFVDKLHPHDEVVNILSELPTDKDIVVSCRSGGRSARVCQLLVQRGFTKVFNLDGGILAWSARVDPSIPQY